MTVGTPQEARQGSGAVLKPLPSRASSREKKTAAQRCHTPTVDSRGSGQQLLNKNGHATNNVKGLDAWVALGGSGPG